MSKLDVLDPFVYKTFHYHDGSPLLRLGEMELVNDPFEMVCRKIRRELVLGVSEKEEKARLKREKYRQKKGGDYVRHSSSLLDRMLDRPAKTTEN